MTSGRGKDVYVASPANPTSGHTPQRNISMTSNGGQDKDMQGSAASNGKHRGNYLNGYQQGTPVN